MLEELAELLDAEVCLFENRAQRFGAQILATVKRDNRPDLWSAGMFKNVVRTRGAVDEKICTLEGTQGLFRRHDGQHGTQRTRAR